MGDEVIRKLPERERERESVCVYVCSREREETALL